MSFELVAFDLGGVLVDVDLSRAWRTLGADESSAFFADDGHAQVTRGELQVSAWFAGLTHSAADLDRAWRRVVRPFPGARELLASLVIPSLAWSNTDAVHADQMQRSNALAPLFTNGRGLSFELGAAKPEPEFFERALARASISPAKVLFVDDREENVLAASKFGIGAYRTLGIASTAAVLSECGVLAGSP